MHHPSRLVAANAADFARYAYVGQVQANELGGAFGEYRQVGAGVYDEGGYHYDLGLVMIRERQVHGNVRTRGAAFRREESANHIAGTTRILGLVERCLRTMRFVGIPFALNSSRSSAGLSAAPITF